LTDINDILLTL